VQWVALPSCSGLEHIVPASNMCIVEIGGSSSLVLHSAYYSLSLVYPSA
jgi:hypothetical protein